MTAAKHQNDPKAMRLALALARRGYGVTSPNPFGIFLQQLWSSSFR
jgi:hypothetical protein